MNRPPTTPPEKPPIDELLSSRSVRANADVRESTDAEIRLIRRHLHELRELDSSLLLSLVRVECYVVTELIHMEQRTPKYSPNRLPEREKLQRRLGEIEKERRTIAVHSTERRQTLELRLLTLLERQALLSGSQSKSDSSSKS